VRFCAGKYIKSRFGWESLTLFKMGLCFHDFLKEVTYTYIRTSYYEIITTIQRVTLLLPVLVSLTQIINDK
jgi:hypothetical protein